MAKATKKAKSTYMCSDCGWEHPVWQGQCGSCAAWNTLVEFKEKPLANLGISSSVMAGGGVRKPTSMTEVKENNYPGFTSGINELDRVLGGRIVHGSVTLIAAEPGKGKSTLLTQAAGKIAEKVGNSLYCSGEENEIQIKDRAKRLGLNNERLYLYNTEDLVEILNAIENLKPAFVVVDSIQHLRNPEIEGAQGSTKQIESCAKILVNVAKRTGTAIFIVGHVTKDDSIAGPRKLEHIVDTVLYLEGDPTTDLRLLRAQKNRMGATTEIGVFKMEQEGMMEISNPSEYLIANRSSDDSGSTIVCTSGKRPMLIEVQALVSGTSYENAIPRRTSRGFEKDRFNILIAVLEKKCGIPLGIKDVYLNIVGGLKLNEPGTDLGVAMAIASSERDVVINPLTCVIGEIGLNGEVRPVRDIEMLVKEAEKNGFKDFILPEQNFERAEKIAKKIQLIPVKKVSQAITLVLGAKPKKKQ
ncbi:DNA repair protein RadA [Bacillus cereus]|uniref:DNA repair protein RadA n=2 Tax=Bacillus cereus group TaxID=86661 RepID=A0A9X6XVS8_BACCE|nr:MULTISPECIES: DNA repair protein RadA [Bacillus cereus group]PDZ95162.1 DNA repair protein RadA [Bacillus cereus]PFJ29372.1 DNA repair protein RadA [Bacillus thuringiensis]